MQTLPDAFGGFVSGSWSLYIPDNTNALVCLAFANLVDGRLYTNYASAHPANCISNITHHIT